MFCVFTACSPINPGFLLSECQPIRRKPICCPIWRLRLGKLATVSHRSFNLLHLTARTTRVMFNKQIKCLFCLECGPVKWRCPIETECWVIAPLNVLFLSEVWVSDEIVGHGVSWCRYCIDLWIDKRAGENLICWFGHIYFFVFGFFCHGNWSHAPC